MRLTTALLVSLTFLIAAPGCSNDKEGEFALGDIQASQLLKSYDDFDENYQAFQLSEEDIKAVQSWPDDLQIEVFFATWCHDSQREVPRFLKLASHKSDLVYQMIALNYQKQDPSGAAEAKGINFTPTFIVYRDQTEIGRIIERPENSLVADISAML